MSAENQPVTQAQSLRRGVVAGKTFGSVSAEQAQAYARTANAVANATRPYADTTSKSGLKQSVIQGGLVITKDVLDAAFEGLRLVPVPGVAEAVNAVIKIWDFVKQVEVCQIYLLVHC